MFGVNKKLKGLVALAGLGAAMAFAAWFWFVKSDNNDNSLTLYGNVDIREVQLAFRQPGRVKQMFFEEGDAVTAGTLLATLDTQPFEDSLAAAEANVQLAIAEANKLRSGMRPQEIEQSRALLNQALASQANAENHFRRQNELLPSGASTQQDVDAARASFDKALAVAEAAQAALSQATEGFRSEDIAAGEARLASAQAALAQARTALGDAELTAPSDGTIIARVREPGSMVASQSTVYSLSLDQPVYVRAYVNEPDLGRIAPGTRVSVKSDSSDKTWGGQIGFISPRAEFTPKAVETTELRTDLVYRLRIVIDEADMDGGLRQGMPVTITVGATEP